MKKTRKGIRGAILFLRYAGMNDESRKKIQDKILSNASIRMFCYLRSCGLIKWNNSITYGEKNIQVVLNDLHLTDKGKKLLDKVEYKFIKDKME